MFQPLCSGVTYWLVGHGVVPPEEACSDEVSYEYIYSVVVMSEEDAENTHSRQRPTAPVVPPETPRGVCGAQKYAKFDYLRLSTYHWKAKTQSDGNKSYKKCNNSRQETCYDPDKWGINTFHTIICATAHYYFITGFKSLSLCVSLCVLLSCSGVQ